MTPEELKNNPDLLAQCAKEVEEKVRAGQDPEQAKLEVFKAHGVQFDEDAAKAKLVGRMQLSDEELKNVAGGTDCGSGFHGNSIGISCISDYGCYYTYSHSIQTGPGDACFWNYECACLWTCDLDGT